MRIRAASPPHLLFAALADPLRLRTLNLLRDREMCVGDLVTCLQVPQPTASRHLSALKTAGLITSRKQGYWTYYALASGHDGLRTKLLDCIDECRSDKVLAADLKRASRLRAKGGCCPL